MTSFQKDKGTWKSSNRTEGQEEIHSPEEKLQKYGIILLVSALIFTLIGVFNSPLDNQGKPFLLLPDVKLVEDYRHSALSWIGEIKAIDSEVAGIIGSDQTGDLFTQSRVAQQTLQQAIDLAQQVDVTKVPPVAIGLHDQMLTTAKAYLDAAGAALQWVSAPEKANYDNAIQKLEIARTYYSEVEVNQWLGSH